jgi:hypothetical protein
MRFTLSFPGTRDSEPYVDLDEDGVTGALETEAATSAADAGGDVLENNTAEGRAQLAAYVLRRAQDAFREVLAGRDDQGRYRDPNGVVFQLDLVKEPASE